MNNSRMENKIKCIPELQAKTFIAECLTAVGTSDGHAQSMAELLVTADLRGHFSHGMNRLEMYVRDVQSGITAKEGQPVTEKESAATALVDGKNCLGGVVGNYCMDLAIKKAKECGVGWVVAHASNHYGIAGHYALKAAKAGLVGMSMTNTSPLVVPTRAKVCTLGTNPIACAAPGKGEDKLVVDMATSAVALGKVELHKRKGITIPNGWGADCGGKETNNPAEVLDGGGLLPLGGSEESGGYKGYGLAMMVEMMCGIMSGATYGPNVRRWGTTDRVADLGQCFIAVNPEMFCGGFQDRMQDLMDIHRNLEPADPGKPVLAAGDPERAHIKKCEGLGGIPYPANVVDHMNGLGKELGVKIMVPIN